jgi:hypothetical protein
MKALIMVVLLAAAMPILHAEDTAQEKDFKNRFESVLKSGDINQVTNICANGIPCHMMLSDFSYVELCFWRGAKSVRFEEVFPTIKDSIKQGVTIDGVKIVPNLEAYKMVTVEYEKSMTNESTGFSILTGIKDGKIMITGYKISDK